IYPDDELLERLAYNVEFPFVFQGAFPERYLELPIEVLATAMREGQKLFSVVKDRKQLPVFLGIADAPEDPRGLIRTGNERVLKARLEDARFFWEQDTRKPLIERAVGLKNVVYQEKLGSYEEKVQRMRKIVAYLCDRTDSAKIKKEAVEAVGLCKADLLTGMVREFPSLQGKMGGLYAKAEGYPVAVHQAVYEHYRPASLEDEPPSSMTGALVSLADKIDSIVGAVGVGLQVSGSSDPFGLRRNAHGVCAIIIEKKLDLSFVLLLDKVLSVLGDKLLKPRAEVKAACLEFFEGRLRYIFEKQGFRYDLIEAALGPGIDRIAHSFRRVKALDGLKSSPDFEPFILMAKRINNILKDAPAYRLNPDLFVEKEERELHSNLVIIRDNAGPMIEKGDFARAQSIILRLRPSLNAFFDKVLVMAEDKKVRQNRLGLLQAIRKLLLEIADYSRVVVEGEKTGKPGNSR
ncbi:MAG TPA: glycine--tRNA ligase subunit beta, partial [Acidobacteriota bacterium]|nr:glycine--tRNA ligase subunit beta [Acidobacteriota bacterium]